MPAPLTQRQSTSCSLELQTIDAAGLRFISVSLTHPASRKGRDEIRADFSPEPIESTVNELPKSGLSPSLMHAMERGNAERLFPRFKV